MEDCFAMDRLVFCFILNACIVDSISTFTVHLMAYDPFIQRKQQQPSPHVTQQLQRDQLRKGRGQIEKQSSVLMGLSV